MNGKQLRKARKAAGLSQAALARLVSLTVRSISGYECGRAIPERTAIALRAVLGAVQALPPQPGPRQEGL